MHQMAFTERLQVREISWGKVKKVRKKSVGQEISEKSTQLLSKVLFSGSRRYP